jgi:GNAT superfamily N-acetyltransferase
VFRIRPATPADADAIADVHVTSWRVAYRGAFPDSLLDADDFESSRHEQWRAWRFPPECAVLVVTEAHPDVGDRVVGFASLGPERDPDAGAPRDRGELYAIYLLPTSFGSGAGDVLLGAVEEALVHRGFGRAVLWVLRDNDRARRFYERWGWHLTGETGWFEPVEGDEVPSVEYVKDLTSRR